MVNASVSDLDRWTTLSSLNGWIEMNEPVKRYCQCGHLEMDHKYRDTTPENLLHLFSQDQNVTVIRDPDSIKILGYKTQQGTYFTYEKALAEVTNARENGSYCQPNLFERTCGCKVYRPDNLKYLEDLSHEHPAS